MAEKTIPAPQEGGELQRETTRAAEQFVPPAVDIFETPEGLTLVCDLPGVRTEDLAVTVKDNILTIRGRAHDDTTGTPVYSEYQLLSFFREFQISDALDTDSISADLKNGVLTLRIPPAPKTQPRQIKVEIA